ncbi:MAG: TIGR03546 family protein [Gemmatimonadota bacterium]|nr:TIGR03546 family protein [Gemmatimonadota bacterium]MDH4351942.1 TIGR03546 family protein [Gemmatimonadota bacterium]MDH5198146.1 TIGR03546 family protein [Gemmatimonadota bacterium]
MLLLKLLQSLIKALNSDGTPGQVAAGIALGAVFGLTPLINLHNLVLFGLAIILNVSFPGVMLGWVLFLPFGFVLDPLFDLVGRALLVDAAALTPFWTWAYNTPVLALTNFNNTIVLGSFVVWLAAFIPLFFLLRWLVTKYRATVYARLQQTPLFRAVKASKIYNAYTLFRP